MDGGKLMAQAVFLVQRVSHETDHEGSAEESDDEDDLRAALSEYIESWKHAGEHIQEAISNGAEVRVAQTNFYLRSARVLCVFSSTSITVRFD